MGFILAHGTEHFSGRSAVRSNLANFPARDNHDEHVGTLSTVLHNHAPRQVRLIVRMGEGEQQAFWGGYMQLQDSKR